MEYNRSPPLNDIKSTPFCYLCKIFSRVVHKLKYEFQLLLTYIIFFYDPKNAYKIFGHFFIFSSLCSFWKVSFRIAMNFFFRALWRQIYQSKTSKTGIFSNIVERVPLSFQSCTNCFHMSFYVNFDNQL